MAAVTVGASATWAAGGGGCSESTEGTGTTVEMVRACFGPSVLRVGEGSTVTFANRDEMVHVVVGIGWGSGDLSPGDELTQRFDAAGIYAYSCYLHPSMNGAVVVGDQAVAATGADPAATGTDSGDSSDSAPLTAGVGVGGLAAGFVAARIAARRARERGEGEGCGPPR